MAFKSILPNNYSNKRLYNFEANYITTFPRYPIHPFYLSNQHKT